MDTSIDLKNLGESINDIIGELNNLNTTDKTNLISSINELKTKVDILSLNANVPGSEAISTIIEEFVEHKNIYSSTTIKGHVKLNDTLTSLSDAEALTAVKGKILKDQIDSLNQQLAEYINTPVDISAAEIQSAIDSNTSIIDLLSIKHTHTNSGLLNKLTEMNSKSSYDLSSMVTRDELQSSMTSEKINTITEKLITERPSSYPIGMTIFKDLNSWSSSITKLRNKVTIVQTNKYTDSYATQIAIILENDATSKIIDIYRRAAGELNGWSDWQKEVSYIDLISTIQKESVKIIDSDILALENKLNSNEDGSGASLIGVGSVGARLDSSNVESCLQHLSDLHESQKVNLSSTDVLKGASLIGIYDVGERIEASNVETALQELARNIEIQKIDLAGYKIFTSVSRMKESNRIKLKDKIRTTGYFQEGDVGECEYVVSDVNYSWSIPLLNGLYANVSKKDFVNYKMFGAALDGVTDDSIALNQAHAYCCAHKILLKNQEGIIYKKDQEYIEVSHDVDLTGSCMLITNDNCYSFYRLFNDDKIIYDYTLQKSELFKDASYFTMNDNSLPYNCVLNITDKNAWATRNDAGLMYPDYRTDIMYHNCYGICTGNLIYGYDGIDTDLKVTYSRYNSRRLNFKGCEIRIETTPNVTVGTIQCYRHNALLENFHIKTKPNSMGNSQYKGTVIEVKNAFNVEIKNIVGTNIAGDATHKGSGYTLRLLNCYKVKISDCNINGFWGCTGMDSVKDISFENCTLNRVDVHDYFSNLYINNCVIYDWGINIGCGTGNVTITNCKFVQFTKPNFGGQAIVNINNSYGHLFDGNIIIRDVEIVKDNINMAFIKISYIQGTGVIPRAKVKVPNLLIDNVNIRNINNNSSKFILFSLNNTCDYKSIEKPDYITISNITYLNPNSSHGTIEMINDSSTQDMYSTNIKTSINISNVIFCDDKVVEPIQAIDPKFIDIYVATNSNISFRTDTKFFDNCDLTVDNVKMVLYNANSNMRLVVNNSIIYGFVESSVVTNTNKVIINNSTLRIFGYNIETNKCTIPTGTYQTCTFNPYTYLKPSDANVYTSVVTIGSNAKLLNTNLGTNIIL